MSTQVNPTLNPVTVKVYRISDSAEKHPYRNRYLNKDSDFELLTTIPAQVHFFSKESLRRRDEQESLRSLGYVWFNYQHAIIDGVYPVEESWVGYRVQIPGLGIKLYDIIEAIPRCHLNGAWLYMRLDFEECYLEAPTETTENTEEVPYNRTPLFDANEYEQEVHP